MVYCQHLSPSPSSILADAFQSVVTKSSLLTEVIQWQIILTHQAWVSNQRCCTCKGNYAQCHVATWMGGESGENGYMYAYGWVPLLCTWNYHNIVNGYIPIQNTAAAAAKSQQSCLNLCDPIDGSPPGSSVPGILQARILEWLAISFSNVCMHACMVSRFSHVWLFATPWTAAHQAALSTGFSRQEYCSGFPFPSPYKRQSLKKKKKKASFSNLLHLTIGSKKNIFT